MFSAEELKFFDENGYVILKSLYNKTQVAELEAIANSLRVKAFEIAKNRPTGNEKVNKAIVNNKNFYIYNSGTKFSFKYTTPNTQPDTSELPSIARIIWAGAYEPELLNYQKHQHLTTHVAELLKSTYANHVANQIHYKIPGDGIAFDIHQDLRGLKRLNKEVWTNVNNRGSALNTITAIDEITTENGPLKVIPQSHLKGDLNLPYKSAEYFNQHHKEEYGFDAIYDAITIKMAPGDTLFMSPYLAHYSEANNSAQERKVLINEFLFPELMQYQTSGEGSGKLIRLDPNLKFSDIVFSLNAMISIANICKKLDTLAHEQTFDNYIALSMDLSHFAAIYVGRNVYTDSFMFLNALAVNLYHNYDEKVINLNVYTTINFAYSALNPMINNHLIGTACYYLSKYFEIDNFPYAPYVGSAYGALFLAYNAYSFYTDLMGKSEEYHEYF